MSYISIDVEADGPIPGDYSMVSFGAVISDGKFDKTFFAQLKPISENYIVDALKSCKLIREETLLYNDAKEEMLRFEQWIKENNQGRPFFISDNNGFDWMFVSWYFHHFIGKNPFGHSSININSMYKGIARDMHKNIKKFRKTKHTHHPVDDAKGNAEAFWAIKEKFGIII